jgi:hypothetical protein
MVSIHRADTELFNRKSRKDSNMTTPFLVIVAWVLLAGSLFFMAFANFAYFYQRHRLRTDPGLPLEQIAANMQGREIRARVNWGCLIPAIATAALSLICLVTYYS